ncbi:MAG: N-acetylmuramoyl-L-alanine amidase [Puniceicoccales bacterium]|jgi:N-acetylmuramoyl-L-alanine amidase|nr:N-acetylmuramoyl-L-alanine amidase [Puniceicoccales bacterium]
MLRKWKKQRINLTENIFFQCLLVCYFFGELALPFSKVFGENIPRNALKPLAKAENVLSLDKLTAFKVGSDLTVPVQKSISTNPFITFSGNRYLALSDIIKSLKCNVISDNGKGSVKITKGGATVQLTAGQDYILYQTPKIYLSHELKFTSKSIYVSYDDYLKVLVPLLAINLVSERTPALRTIVLDPGHGGKDPGAVNGRLNFFEKTLALQIATLLKAELIKKGYAVVLTRESDVFIDLKDRPAKAKNADLFVSIHLNSATNLSAQGTEIYILKQGKNFCGNAFDPWNLIAAYSILSTFEKATNFTNRGIKMAEFAVLKSLACPGILVEVGFISNDAEAKKLVDVNFQKKVIQGLADGIVQYGENLKKKR